MTAEEPERGGPGISLLFPGRLALSRLPQPQTAEKRARLGEGRERRLARDAGAGVAEFGQDPLHRLHLGGDH